MRKKILVAPLNWGLGHATRSIPIINALIARNYEPIIASDGEALALLKKEFPNLTCLELPGYGVRYSKKGYSLKLKLLKNSHKVFKAIIAEHKTTHQIVERYNIDGIISDNRYGVYSKHIPSVFMTHQLQVLSGNTTWLSTRIQQFFLKSILECWVPDFEDSPNLSGALGHVKHSNFDVKYIGPLSRFKKYDCKIRYDVMVLLSGPEPQRSILEEILLGELKDYEGKVLFVKGIIENVQKIEQKGQMTIYNYLLGIELEQALNESDLIISRSGYTTIMDLVKLKKKALFIPTPGQFEQEYLAQNFQDKNLVLYCKQDDFNIGLIKEAKKYKGLKMTCSDVDFNGLFRLFESK